MLGCDDVPPVAMLDAAEAAQPELHWGLRAYDCEGTQTGTLRRYGPVVSLFSLRRSRWLQVKVKGDGWRPET